MLCTFKCEYISLAAQSHFPAHTILSTFLTYISYIICQAHALIHFFFRDYALYRNVCRSEISVMHASNRINVAIMPALVHIATKTKRVPVMPFTMCPSVLLSATKPSICAKIEKVRLDFGFLYILYFFYLLIFPHCCRVQGVSVFFF